MWYVGVYGFSWSSAVSTNDSYCLYFNNAWSMPNHSTTRANGFQLRCLQE
ncbi:MAG: hypothetical protein K2K83_03300 [Rikenella sp.]|nr:hypothetical protein [Rikenella sp.]